MQAFKAQRIRRSAKITVHAPVNRVFPLITPEKERKWADGWDFDLIYPLKYRIDQDLMFTTNSHDDKQSESLWILITYHPRQYLIEYLSIEPHIKTGRIHIQCQAKSNKQAIVSVVYSYTALSESGNLFIKNFTHKKYLQYIGSWEQALNFYLETGELRNSE